MKASDFHSEFRDGAARLSVQVRSPRTDQACELWFRFAGLDTAPAHWPDAVALSLFASCLAAGEDLELHAPLSAEVARKIDVIRERLAPNYPQTATSEIRANQYTPDMRDPSQALGCAQCVTGAFTSLPQPSDMVSHVLLVRGLDRALDDQRTWFDAQRRLADIARQVNRRFVTSQTNLRAVLQGLAMRDTIVPHSYIESSAISAIAYLLRDQIGKFVIMPRQTVEASVTPFTAASRYRAGSTLQN